MGAAMAGKPYVPLNYRLSQAQLDPLLERITPTFLIHGASLSQPDQKSGRAQLSTDFLDYVMAGERPEIDWAEDGLCGCGTTLHQRHHGYPQGSHSQARASGILYSRFR